MGKGRGIWKAPKKIRREYEKLNKCDIITKDRGYSRRDWSTVLNAVEKSNTKIRIPIDLSNSESLVTTREKATE